MEAGRIATTIIMRNICDHCGGDTGQMHSDQYTVWCISCVKENIDLLNGLSLRGDGGLIRIYTNTPLIISYPDNIEKLAAIPKKGQALPPAPVPEPKEPTIEIEFDFHIYNTTFAGKRYG
jgi:hypothetical protein